MSEKKIFNSGNKSIASEAKQTSVGSALSEPVTNLDACSLCGHTLSRCQCSHTALTESIHSIFTKRSVFPELATHRHHLCLFVYHTYQRWTALASSNEFSNAYLPLFEGWYAAYLSIHPDSQKLVTFSTNLVLPCSIVYADGRKSNGHITRDGRIYVKMPSASPPDGADYDSTRGLVTTHVRATQMLTLDEITFSLRGRVIGYQSNVPNNGRRVSHLVSRNQDEYGRCLAYTLPQQWGDDQQLVHLNYTDVMSISPHLYEETQLRHLRRYTKDEAKLVKIYLSALFAEMDRNDQQVRYIIYNKWQQELPPVRDLLHSFSEALDDLTHFTASANPEDSINCQYHDRDYESVDRRRVRIEGGHTDSGANSHPSSLGP